MKVCEGRRNVFPLVLKLGTRWGGWLALREAALASERAIDIN